MSDSLSQSLKPTKKEDPQLFLTQACVPETAI